jgi:hypothetical protein
MHAIQKMMVGPSMAQFRLSHQTTFRCCVSNDVVLSVKEKASERRIQVKIKEVNVSEPPDRSIETGNNSDQNRDDCLRSGISLTGT